MLHSKRLLICNKTPGNGHDSGVCVNMLMSEHVKPQYKDFYWMKYVR